MEHKIVPLNIGNYLELPKQTCMYRMYREITYEAPCIMWYLQGAEKNILVDLGPPDPEQTMKNHGMKIARNEKQTIEGALKSVNLKTTDIDIVIMTHLHYDHAWGYNFFQNARFIIQRREIEYAIAPLPCHQAIYYEKHIEKPQFVDYLSNIDIIDGDFEVCKGIKAILLPGHSPGFQGVLVETKEGKYMIAGDTIGLFECWENIPHVPSGLYNNLEDSYKSLRKIESISDHILPGHDPRVFERESYG